MYGEEIKTLRNRPRSCLDFDFCCAKSNGFDFMVMVMGTKSNLAYVPVFRRYFSVILVGGRIAKGKW